MFLFRRLILTNNISYFIIYPFLIHWRLQNQNPKRRILIIIIFIWWHKPFIKRIRLKHSRKNIWDVFWNIYHCSCCFCSCIPLFSLKLNRVRCLLNQLVYLIESIDRSIDRSFFKIKYDIFDETHYFNFIIQRETLS